MAFPYKAFCHNAIPILCLFAMLTFIFNFGVLRNYTYYSKYTSIKPPWATPSRDFPNLTLKEYIQQYFIPPGYPSPPQQYIPECDCYRPWIYHYQKQQLENNLNSSTCSDLGTHISPNQKVVSFVMYFFGDPLTATDPSPQFYKKGIQINLLAMRRYYPGYTIRLHTNIPKDPSFCQLYCENPDLFWCDVRKTPGNFSKMYFTTWRFLPLGDPTVDIFLSRDLDSSLTERESAVVQDWLNLPQRKPIHLMRDKFEVHNIHILGGLWGAKNGYFPKMGEGRDNETAEELAKDIRLNSKVADFTRKRNTGFDQIMLIETVFEKRLDQIVGYDSYNCELWSRRTMIRPFPMQRKDTSSDFVGNVGFGLIKYPLEECPVECRPKWGKDWKYC